MRNRRRSSPRWRTSVEQANDLATELIYRSVPLCTLVNRLLYGRHYSARYRAIADLIPAKSSVLDLCCGPAIIYHRHLKDKGVDYTGLDLSSSFVNQLNQSGGRGVVWDLRTDAPLPRADSVIIQGSLYFFLPDASHVIDRMLAAARKQVIVSESIRNLSSSRIPFVATVAKHLAGAVSGNHPARFTESTLDQFFGRYRDLVRQSFQIPGGRDKVYVLAKSGASAETGE